MPIPKITQLGERTITSSQNALPKTKPATKSMGFHNYASFGSPGAFSTGHFFQGSPDLKEPTKLVKTSRWVDSMNKGLAAIKGAASTIADILAGISMRFLGAYAFAIQAVTQLTCYSNNIFHTLSLDNTHTGTIKQPNTKADSTLPTKDPKEKGTDIPFSKKLTEKKGGPKFTKKITAQQGDACPIIKSSEKTSNVNNEEYFLGKASHPQFINYNSVDALFKRFLHGKDSQIPEQINADRIKGDLSRTNSTTILIDNEDLTKEFEDLAFIDNLCQKNPKFKNIHQSSIWIVCNIAHGAGGLLYNLANCNASFELIEKRTININTSEGIVESTNQMKYFSKKNKTFIAGFSVTSTYDYQNSKITSASCTEITHHTIPLKQEKQSFESGILRSRHNREEKTSR